jgi:hypothetical protein
VNNHEDRRPEKKKNCNNPEGDAISQLTCYNCKEPGHYASKCPEKKKNKTRRREVGKESSKKDISQVECHGCRKLGHYAWNCPEKIKGTSQTHFRKGHVNLVKVEKVQGETGCGDRYILAQQSSSTYYLTLMHHIHSHQGYLWIEINYLPKPLVYP